MGLASATTTMHSLYYGENAECGNSGK